MMSLFFFLVFTPLVFGLFLVPHFRGLSAILVAALLASAFLAAAFTRFPCWGFGPGECTAASWGLFLKSFLLLAAYPVAAAAFRGVSLLRRNGGDARLARRINITGLILVAIFWVSFVFHQVSLAL